MPESSTALTIGFIVLGSVQVLNLLVLFLKLSGKPERREIFPSPLSVRNDVDPNEKFAQADHEHSDLLSRTDHEKLCEHRTRETVRVERSIEDLRETIIEFQKESTAREEARTRRLHERIDAFAQPLNQLIGRFENHMEYHRKRGEG